MEIQERERGPNFNRHNSPARQKKACKPHEKAILEQTVKSPFSFSCIYYPPIRFEYNLRTVWIQYQLLPLRVRRHHWHANYLLRSINTLKVKNSEFSDGIDSLISPTNTKDKLAGISTEKNQTLAPSRSDLGAVIYIEIASSMDCVTQDGLSPDKENKLLVLARS